MNPKPLTAAEAVAQGAALLDKRYPGWWRVIDLERLHLASCHDCICGQVATNLLSYRGGKGLFISPYRFVRERLGLSTGTDHGFATRESKSWSYADLEREWRLLIEARFAGDTTISTVQS